MTHSERVISFDGKDAGYTAHVPTSIPLGKKLSFPVVRIFVNCFTSPACSASERVRLMCFSSHSPYSAHSKVN